MPDHITGIVGIVVLVVLMLIRVPIGSAMLAVSAAGIYIIRPQAALPALANEAFSALTTYSLIILPLFILMGAFASITGLNRDLFKTAHAWFGHLRGGLAVSTIIGCAAFSALSGSSVAAAATMGRATLPEMRRFKYSDSLATGAVAAGGTLGILIPPSAGFVLYAMLTEQSINQLFMAGILPGLLLTLLFIVAVSIVVRLNPNLAPVRVEPVNLRSRFSSLRNSGGLMLVIIGILGGIYLGIFDVVEAAGAGTLFVLLIGLKRRVLGLRQLSQSLYSTLKSTGAIFYVQIGAYAFKTFIAFTGIPIALVQLVDNSGVPGIYVAYIFLVVLIVLGMFLDSFAILVLTLPLIQPILSDAGVDLIWFGVLTVITLEMGLISPPVGLNVFVVKEFAGDVPLKVIFRGIWPFWIAMLTALLLIIAFPQIAILLPRTMFS